MFQHRYIYALCQRWRRDNNHDWAGFLSNMYQNTAENNTPYSEVAVDHCRNQSTVPWGLYKQQSGCAYAPDPGWFQQHRSAFLFHWTLHVERDGSAGHPLNTQTHNTLIIMHQSVMAMKSDEADSLRRHIYWVAVQQQLQSARRIITVFSTAKWCLKIVSD